MRSVRSLVDRDLLSVLDLREDGAAVHDRVPLERAVNVAELGVFDLVFGPRIGSALLLLLGLLARRVGPAVLVALLHERLAGARTGKAPLADLLRALRALDTGHEVVGHQSGH